MSYFDARCDTEAELHTIGALLCLLDDAAVTHLTQDETPVTSGIINLIQVVGDRVRKAQELHFAEIDAQRAGRAEENPLVAMHREITRLRVISEAALTDAETDAATEEIFKIADAVVDIPARDLGEMMLKFMCLTINGDHSTGDCPNHELFWAEARALIGGAA